MKKRICTQTWFMGVNVGQELPCPSSSHTPNAMGICVLQNRYLCWWEPQEPFPGLWGAQWWGTPERKVLPVCGLQEVQLSCPGHAPVHSILMGTSPRRHHLLWDHFQPMDLCAAAGNKAQPARLEVRFACWSLQGLGREAKAGQPSLALLWSPFSRTVHVHD